MFGLLALLLAFSFGMALDRFEQRRALVVAEVNALSTLASRLDLLPEQNADSLRLMLAAYGRERLAFGAAPNDRSAFAASDRAEVLYARIGRSIHSALGRSAPDPRGPAVLQPFNEAGDIASTRRAAREGHLPRTVLALLGVFCVSGAAMLGYSRAGQPLVHRPAGYLFLAMLAVAFITILDIDRPREGSIIVPQLAMERQVAALAAQARRDPQ